MYASASASLTARWVSVARRKQLPQPDPEDVAPLFDEHEFVCDLVPGDAIAPLHSIRVVEYLDAAGIPRLTWDVVSEDGLKLIGMLQVVMQHIVEGELINNCGELEDEDEGGEDEHLV